ncbi:AAA family ATPase [Mesorhizobium sp. GbtcB19]|uniref:AAA family ATPase n=1 Tax=Mesorhizobium sp. GbtcB19 TaxID=2824764 RepID=UPI001C307ABC|nr:ATP-binding protein [Mesorhizobium sp. GbtcB19]
MRLDRAEIYGFRNLDAFEITFDKRRLTTVVIGENASGKSNLIEALVEIFRAADLGVNVHFQFEVEYRLSGRKVKLSNKNGTIAATLDGKELTKTALDDRRADVLPDMIFGYYSGSSRRLERLFDDHQRRYYNVIKTNEDPAACRAALAERRLFYCRPIHGVFALAAFFAFPDHEVLHSLREKLNIGNFGSALAYFREPWFAKSKPRSTRDPFKLWGAAGPAGACARAWLDAAYYPIDLEDQPRDDYRDKDESESQLACFIRSSADLAKLAANYYDDSDMFAALEAADISDLFRDLLLWVSRSNEGHEIGYSELSDGERQLLMVLGLTRISRGKRVLFLLDEPDTHLNPSWQLEYLKLIKSWTGQDEEADNCQFILTSHNPLTIAALKKEEVRVMSSASGEARAYQPRVDPRGLGFSGVLVDVFGLQSAIDEPTRDLIDERNTLVRQEALTSKQKARLETLTFELANMGITYEHRDRLYREFLRQFDKLQLEGDRPLTPDELEEMAKESERLVKEIRSRQ